MVAFAFATVAALAQPLVGHVLGLRVGDTQPAKLAAFELAETTEQPAPLRIGGVMIDDEPRYYVEIPVIGSLIARNSFDEPVPGLDTIPVDERPPVTLTHLAFQTMVGIGTLLALSVLVFWYLRRRGRDPLAGRWFLRYTVIAGPLAIVALEAGWIATEVGRQPWVVYGVLRTTDAAGDSPWIWWSLIGTVVVYTGLTVGAAVVLRSMASRWRAGDHDLPSPYGPEAT
jgi:cytochrome d ubiquinol oxidase subunit I